MAKLGTGGKNSSCIVSLAKWPNEYFLFFIYFSGCRLVGDFVGWLLLFPIIDCIFYPFLIFKLSFLNKLTFCNISSFFSEIKLFYF
jgi:hypothetical protein